MKESLRNARRDRRELRNARRERLTLDDLRTRDSLAYGAFMDFTEAQTMFWELSVGPAGDLWADDWQMNVRVQWVPSIGQWL